MNSDLFSSSVLGSEITFLAAKELEYTEENQVLKVCLGWPFHMHYEVRNRRQSCCSLNRSCSKSKLKILGTIFVASQKNSEDE